MSDSDKSEIKMIEDENKFFESKDGEENDENEEEGDEETESEEDEEETEEDETDSDQENVSLDECPLSPNSLPTCYICLNHFEGQEIGSPDSCDDIHNFCLECIEEWSKQVNTCPVDRNFFQFIIVRRIINGKVVMKVPIAKRSVVEIVTMEDDLTYCEICGRCDREDSLLLCDGCDFGYHCECLTPPLETVPVDEWFCPDCFERLFCQDLNGESNQNQPAIRRALARTGAFERVRNRIMARRTVSGHNQNIKRNTIKKKRKRRKTKRKQVKKRKTTKNGRKKSKRKKRTKKSKLSTKRLPLANPRTRLASKLGLFCKPSSTFTSSNKLSAESRFSMGINNLSLFGYELEFNNPRSYEDAFEFESNDFRDPGGGIMTSTIRHHVSPIVNKLIKSPEPLLSINSFDVLGEIMSSQELLHASSCDLSISRDGKIYLKSDTAKNVRKCADQHSSTSSNGVSANGKMKQTQQSSSYSQHENTQQHHDSDISLIKPAPIVPLIDENHDTEMYSDIESIGDKENNNDDEEKEEKNIKENKWEKLNENSFSKIDSDSSSLAKKTLKRRLSIKNLFGGDSDEGDDNDEDIRQLVTQQSSINVHFPIKMPIILKTNFIEDKKKLEEQIDEIPISKKWVPIFPETNDKFKNSGPKWKAVGTRNSSVSSSKKNMPDIFNDNHLKTKLDFLNDDLDLSKIESEKHLEDEIILEKTYATLKTNDLEELNCSKKLDETSISDSLTFDKKNDEKKTRTCKHGRVINKEKDKKRLAIESSNSKLSEVFEKSKKTSLKKYEDSKPKECKKTQDSKNKLESRQFTSKNKFESQGNENFVSILKTQKTEKISPTNKKLNDISKNDKVQKKSHHQERKYQRLNSHFSEEIKKPQEIYKHDKSSKHRKLMHERNNYEESDFRDKSSSSRSHRHHHHHHHRHKKSDSISNSNKKKEKKSDTVNSNFNKDSTKFKKNETTFNAQKKSTYQQYPSIKSMDSKEIYAEGDKIIINVNFKSEKDEENVTNTADFKNKSDMSESRTKFDKSKNNDTLSSEKSCSNSKKFLKLPFSTTEMENILSEEFKFLPKLKEINGSLNNINIVHHRTPEVCYDDEPNSFIPTPTQDESQSPSSNRIKSTVSKKSCSKRAQSKNSPKDDFYDPELPLQSPDQDDSLKSPFNLNDKSLESCLSEDKQARIVSTKPSNLTSTTSATAKLASLNSFDLNHLVKLAKTFNNTNNDSQKNMHHKTNLSTSSSTVLNRDIVEIVDMDVDDSPFSSSLPSPSSETNSNNNALSNVKEIWDQIVQRASSKERSNVGNNGADKSSNFKSDEQPISAVDMENKQKYIKKIHRQERVIEEVKLSLKPHYQKKKITKDEYKNILRKAVPKICHNKNGEINPLKISKLVEAYVKHFRHMRKK